MTENQEKELFTTLATLVTGVRGIQTDVTEIKQTLGEHSQILNEHSQILNNHSQALNRLEAKTDNIATTVMANGKRLDNVEKEIDDLRGEVH